MANWYGDNVRGRVALYLGNDPTFAAYFQLHGNSQDNSLNGQNGSDTNMLYGVIPGKLGKPAHFQGNNAYIQLPSPGNLPQSTSDQTMMAWVNATSITGGTSVNIIFSQSKSWEYFMYNASQIQVGSDLHGVVNNSKGIPTDGKWHHICVVFHTGTGNFDFYIDGVYDSTVSSGGGLITGASTVARVGIYYNQTATYGFNGDMEEFAYFNRAWTGQQVAQYYAWATKRRAILWKRAFSAAASYSKAVSISMMNSVSRLATVARRFVGTRTASISQMEGASRTQTIARGLTLVRKVSLSMMYAASRVVQFVARFPLWQFRSKHATSWSSRAKNAATWTPRSKHTSTWTPRARSSPSNTQTTGSTPN